MRSSGQIRRVAVRKARLAARRAQRRLAPAQHAAWRRARALPVPGPVRARLHGVLPWRPWPVTVPVDRLLLGLQNGMPAADFARAHAGLLWTSTRLVDGPHAELLRAAARTDRLTDAEILATDYATLARQCIEVRGCFFWATDDAGIVEVARDFIDRHGGAPAADAREHQSASDSPLRVAPIRRSDCFQVLDGHHRLASMAVEGARTARVRVKWLPVRTALQDLLNEMSWIDGGPELYQPIDAPELAKSWVTVRRCTDRRDKMLSFLDSERVVDRAGAEQPSYLDVASCYGWFVAQLRAAGFEASGLERDPLAQPLGAAAYGLDPAAVVVGDAVDLLTSSGRQWDVVSCFSLLHHFVLGRGSVSAEELLSLLDKATRRVLFIDTGQDHEEWFRDSLRGWDTAYVRTFLTANTTFDEVIDLGPDVDAVPPYQNNYGRHLFACVRRHPG